ncbi:unnamed protein product [Linum tenue]|uniref:Uncharacterized protein n=1 Tax=Linum tenue TaxID=586396 RepID=A0AAV0JJ68_9ROSI|nr:unnamed protein product [Linum tenue]
MAAPTHSKLIIIVFLLQLISTNPAISMAAAAADHLANPQVSYQMRKLLQMDLVLDYEKDPGANTKHLPGPKPPTKPGVGG